MYKNISSERLSLISSYVKFNYSENKGKTDWLGIDDGTRGIPGGVPTAKELKNVSTYAQKAEYAKLFSDYKWGIKSICTRPNCLSVLMRRFNASLVGASPAKATTLNMAPFESA